VPRLRGLSFGPVLFLAIGLAMDATAVSAARGLAAPALLPRHVALVAVFFGGFQALMPLLGWLVGSQLGRAVEAWDHWIAFVLLGALGGRMLWTARRGEASELEPKGSGADLFGIKVLLVLAVATSIDAFAAGIALPLMDAPFLLSLVTIGVTTAVLSALGLLAGRRFGTVLGSRLDVAGGLILIGMGTKILLEHLGAV
jgi:manganese efflux pump family protein